MIALGALITLAAAGLLPSKGGDAPAWVVACAASIFVFAGSLLVLRSFMGGDMHERELPRGVPLQLRVAYYLLGLAVVGALATVGTWVAFGPGERALCSVASVSRQRPCKSLDRARGVRRRRRIDLAVLRRGGGRLVAQAGTRRFRAEITRKREEPRPEPGFCFAQMRRDYCCCGACSGAGSWSCTCVLPAGADATSLVHRSLNTTRLSGVYSLVRQVQGRGAAATAGATA